MSVPDAAALVRIRCVAFDAVGTVVQPVPSAAEMYFRVARRHGSQLPADEISRRFRVMFRETERGRSGQTGENRLATSEANERERWRTIVSAVIDDVPDPQICFEELFDHFARPESWQCFPDVPATFERLRRMGLRLALASNFDGRLHRVCDGHPPLRSVACRVISAEVGFRKPSLRFYEALRKATGCRPEELLMVGDDRQNDWVGAREAGLAAVIVNRGPDRGVGEIGGLLELADRIELACGRESGR